MTHIRKAVLPVAGLGTRFLPVTKSQAKEMLAIIDKPVIQHLVEEAVASGIEEIIFVTNHEKPEIKTYFSETPELEKTLKKRGKLKLLETIKSIPKLAKFSYAIQPEPLGDGHAILCAKELIGNEPFAVLFGDDIINGTTPAIKQLIDIYEEKKSSVIGLEKIPKEKTLLYGVIEPEYSKKRLSKISDLVEKPSPEEAPSNLAIIGKYIVTPNIFPALEKSNSSHGGEIRLIDGFKELIKSENVYGYELEGERFDTGEKLGLIKANINFGLQRTDLAPQLISYLKTLDL